MEELWLIYMATLRDIHSDVEGKYKGSDVKEIEAAKDIMRRLDNQKFIRNELHDPGTNHRGRTSIIPSP